jgi:hypothetical protein
VHTRNSWFGASKMAITTTSAIRRIGTLFLVLVMRMSLNYHIGVINRHWNTYSNNCGSICGDCKSDGKLSMGCVFKMGEKQWVQSPENQHTRAHLCVGVLIKTNIPQYYFNNTARRTKKFPSPHHTSHPLHNLRCFRHTLSSFRVNNTMPSVCTVSTHRWRENRMNYTMLNY